MHYSNPSVTEGQKHTHTLQLLHHLVLALTSWAMVSWKGLQIRKSSIWSWMMEKHTISAIITSILHLTFKECMSFISQLTMRHGWLARHPLTAWRRKWGNEKAATPAPAPTPKPSLIPSATKLSLAKSLQEALTTTDGLTGNKFNKIWESSCSALVN